MIITIDGPVASGKSVMADLLAQKLGYIHLNSGFLYRGLSHILLRQVGEIAKMHNEILVHDAAMKPLHLLKIITKEYPQLLTIDYIQDLITQENLRYDFDLVQGSKIFLKEIDVTIHLRTSEIDSAASIIAQHPAVRAVLLTVQREIADKQSLIADGRDCGTVVFPYADYKFFLTASLEVRAYRYGCRAKTLQENVRENLQFNQAFLQCLEQIRERDERDEKRAIAPLKPANDAYIIDSSKMTIQEVIDKMIAIINI